MLTLYAAGGTCSLATAIALEEANAQYELYKVDFSAGEQRKPEYLAKNPKGRVPALVTDQGILTENVAILAYIAQMYPEAHLAPRDPFHFGEMQALNAYFASTVHVNHAHRVRWYRWSDDEAAGKTMQAKVPQTMNECFAILENMFKGPWIMGQQFTTADGYLYLFEGWAAKDGVDIANYPKLHDHYKRMGERPAVKAALAKHG